LVPGGAPSTVGVVRLDEAVAEVPTLIKIDVEGAETAVLRGAERFLRSERPPHLIVEHNPVSAAAAGFAPGDVMRVVNLFQPRYKVYWIGWRLWPIRSAEELDRVSRQGNLLISTAPPRRPAR
jgi:hypothetical protein